MWDLRVRKQIIHELFHSRCTVVCLPFIVLLSPHMLLLRSATPQRNDLCKTMQHTVFKRGQVCV